MRQSDDDAGLMRRPVKLAPFGAKANKFICREPKDDARCNVLAGSVRSSKAQPLDAKVLTPSGWRKMGDLRVGDMVIAGDGTATRVEGVFPQGEKEIFRIGFKDGASTECCGEHLWETWTYYERSNFGRNPERKSGQPKIRTTEEIRKSLRSPHLDAINHTIRTVGAVEFEKRPTPIDPYVLGVLLGDGCFRQKRLPSVCYVEVHQVRPDAVGFSSEDQEIVDYLNAHIPDCEVRHRSKYDYDIVFLNSGTTCPSGHEIAGDNAIVHNNRKPSCRKCNNLYQSARYDKKRKRPKKRAAGEYITLPAKRHPIREYLKSAGLAESFSYEKHIPDDYLFNTTSVRLEVLRGLMDTDGSVYSANGGAHFHTTSEHLRDGVRFLIQSFGGTVSESTSIPTFTYNGIKKSGRRVYALALCLPPGIVPFKLARKAGAFKERTRYKPTRYIVSISLIGKKEAQCIRVAHPSHLYVTDDFIVTHNTWAMMVKFLKLCRYQVDGQKLLFGATKQSVYRNVLLDLFDLVGSENYSYNRMSGELTLCNSKWIVLGAHDEGSEKAIRGMTIGAAVGDELVLAPRSFFMQLMARMSPEGARGYYTTNPGSPHHWLKTEILDSQKMTHGLAGADVWWQTWTLRDNPNISQAFKDSLDRSYFGVWRARFIEGRWVQAEGSIYGSMLSPDTFYSDGERPVGLLSERGHKQHVVIVDAGVVNAQAYGDAYESHDGTWFIESEYYFDSKKEERQLTDSQYADHLINGYREWPAFPQDQRRWPSVIVDPSAASFKAELASRGVWVVDANNEVLDGIRRTSSMLGKRRLRIHARCRNIRSDLENYVWDEKAAARGEEKPVKVADHGADLCRYLIETKVPDWELVK